MFVQATVQLRIVAPPGGGTAAGCFRLRHSGGFFGDPIWLVVNADPSLAPYAGDDGAAAAAAQQQMMLEQQQQQEYQIQMMAAQQQQEQMAAQQQQQGMFGQQPQPGAQSGAPGGPADPGRLFQQAAAGAGIGAQQHPLDLDEDDMDL